MRAEPKLVVIPHSTCITCGESKRTTEFFRDRHRLRGVSQRCKVCDREFKARRTVSMRLGYYGLLGRLAKKRGCSRAALIEDLITAAAQRAGVK